MGMRISERRSLLIRDARAIAAKPPKLGAPPLPPRLGEPPVPTIPIGEAAILRALIQYKNGLRREQLSVMTRYKGSTRNAYIARLRDRQLVVTRGSLIIATPMGHKAMPDAEPLPTGAALREWYMSRLPIGERVILEIAIRAYPSEIARSAIDGRTVFKHSTRNAYIARLIARELVEDVDGGIRASATLF